MRLSVSNSIQRDNLEYVDQLWHLFKKDSNLVTNDWRLFFEGVEFAGGLNQNQNEIQNPIQSDNQNYAIGVGGAGSTSEKGFNPKELSVYKLIMAYRQYGYLEAQLDPLTNSATPLDLLRLENFELSDRDLSLEFNAGYLLGFQTPVTLDKIVKTLKDKYSSKMALVCADALPDVQAWLYQEYEKSFSRDLSNEQKIRIANQLSEAESFEKFLHSRFVGAKRFSMEGAEAMLPMFDWMTQQSSDYQINESVVGMAHRGRLTMLNCFFEKPAEQLLSGFVGESGTHNPFEEFDGDVKYHLGYRKIKKTKNGEMPVTLAFNPSHLEAVNTVVLGMARAAQRLQRDTKERSKVLPVLIHGDAAFAGQGIVQETLQMSQVRGYRVGGTVHIVVDNQVGFTTNPENSRSTPFASDVAKAIGAPVILVNGDSVESCVKAMDLAIKYRQFWKRDIVINMVCYRRYGHNEGDEPSYTQPQMYKIIKDHPTPREIYHKKLISEGVTTPQVLEAKYAELLAELDKKLQNVRQKEYPIEPYKFEGVWKGLRRSETSDFDQSLPIASGYPISKLKDIGQSLCQYPDGFTPHAKLSRLLDLRAKMASGEEKLDWGTAELLAFGSLLDQGYHVRLTGQDCVRGTFSHRHAGLYDFNTGEPYLALKQKYQGHAEFCVYDSILSEYGVLGFEYGNSISDPNFLSLWEAQFGDFSNGAQIIIDQFIISAESKWQQMSGLVMLLPHGFEGQGPEHSSARLERYLQLCAQNNIQVIVPTTPAQIFHAYRRQMIRPFRKPLVVMSPKSLLRHPMAVSELKDLSEGGFQEVILDEGIKNTKEVETLILCTGKLYYELAQERTKSSKTQTAIVRIEQLYPFPTKQIIAVLKSYPRLKNLVWAQEEPKNMGAYQFMYFKLSEVLFKEGFSHLPLHYVGRSEKSSPAVGSMARHQNEQAQIVKGCFSI